MSNVHARRIGGNLAYWDTHPKRLVGAVGPDVIEFFDDFVRFAVASDALDGWTTTLVEAGGGESTVTKPDGVGGALLLTTDANENDGVTLQVTGESFEFTTGQSAVYFGALFQASEATQIDWLMGLCITDTTLLGGLSDGVYLDKLDGATAITGHAEKNATASDTASTATFAASTDTLVELYYDGLAATPSVEFFVNGTSLGLVTTNIPDDEILTPSIEVLTGSANARTLTLDWVRVIQIGR